MTAKIETSGKKPYETPSLAVYGTLEKRTQMTTNSNAKQGDGNGNSKTG